MKKKNPIKSFSSYSFQLIVELKEQNRFGTAQTYEKVCRSFKSFLSTFFASSSDISMDMITPEVIQDYNRYLRERNVVRNTISFYNRVLRAMYNKSLREYHFNDTKLSLQSKPHTAATCSPVPMRNLLLPQMFLPTSAVPSPNGH